MIVWVEGALLVAAALWVACVGAVACVTGVRSACCTLRPVLAALLVLPVLAAAAVVWAASNPHGHSIAAVAWSSLGPAALLVASVCVAGRYAVLDRVRRVKDRRAAALLTSAATVHPDLSRVLVVPSGRDLALSLSASRLVFISSSVATRPLDEVMSVVAHERAHLRSHHHVFPQLAASIGWFLPSGWRTRFATWVTISTEASADCIVARQGGGEALSRVRSSWSDPSGTLVLQGVQAVREVGSATVRSYLFFSVLVVCVLFLGVAVCQLDAVL